MDLIACICAAANAWKQAVKLSFQTLWFWFWVVVPEVTLDSLDSLFTPLFFCRWLRISISTSQPRLLSAWSNFQKKKKQLLGIWTPLQTHTWMFKRLPQKCWESAPFPCTPGKVEAAPREREYIWTGFKEKLQVYQEVSELFISSVLQAVCV